MPTGSPVSSRDPAEQGGYRWYVAIVLVVCYSIYNLDKSVVSVLIEPLKREFGISDSAIGLLTGLANSVPFALTCIPVGLLADRVNRVWLLIGMILIWSASTGMAGIATSVAMLFASRIAVGAAEAGFTPVSMSVISDYFTRRQRATALGTFGMGAPLGVFLGMAIGGLVAARYGWRPAFFVAGLPGIVMCVVLALTVREPARRGDDGAIVERGAARTSLRQALRFIGSSAPLLNIIIGMVLSIAPAAGFAIWLPSFFVRVMHVPLVQAGLASATIFGLFSALGAPVNGLIADRLGRRHEHRKLLMPLLGIPAMAFFGLLALFAAPNALWAFVLLAPMAFFQQSMVGAGYGLSSTLTPAAMRTTVLSILLVSINLGSYVLGAQIVGSVSDLVARRGVVNSLSWGMAATFLCSAWALGHFLVAAKLMKRGRANTG